VKVALARGVRGLRTALGALSSLAAPADFERAGAAVARAARRARRAVRAARVATATAARARRQAAAGFLDYAQAGDALVLVGRYMTTDDPRGDAKIELATGKLASGRRKLVAAGRLVGVRVKLPGS
jgi:hypothetical protein